VRIHEVFVTGSAESLIKWRVHPGLRGTDPDRALHYGEMARLPPRGDVVTKEQAAHLIKAAGDYQRIVGQRCLK
jgi:hypothetical protein